MPVMLERAPRFAFPRPVHVSVAGEATRHRVLAGNLSRGGIFLRGDRALSPGTKLALSLEAGGRALPFAEGEVVWSNPSGLPGFGVRFVRFLHPRASALVEHLLHRLPHHRTAKATMQMPAPEPTPSTPPVPAPAWADSIDPAARANPNEERWFQEPELPGPTALEANDSASRVGTAAVLVVFLALVAGGLLWVIRRDATPPVAETAEAAAEPAATAEATTLAPPSAGATEEGSAAAAHAATPSAAAAEPGTVATRTAAAPSAAAAEPNTQATRIAGAAPSVAAAEPDTVATRTAGAAPGAATAEPATVATRTAGGAPSAATAEPATEAAAPHAAASPRAQPGSTTADAHAPSAGAASHAVPHPSSTSTQHAVAAPTGAKAAAVKPRPSAQPAAARSVTRALALPSGAVKSVTLTRSGTTVKAQLALVAGAKVDRVFVLRAPDRAVVDVKGARPQGSAKLASRDAGVSGIRVGALPGGTRLVLDLTAPASAATLEGHTVRITLR